VEKNEKVSKTAAALGHIYIQDEEEESSGNQAQRKQKKQINNNANDEKVSKITPAALGHIHIKDDEEGEGFETLASLNSANEKTAMAGTTIPGQPTTLPGAVRMVPGKGPAHYPNGIVSTYTQDGSEDLSQRHHDDTISLKSSPAKEEENTSPYLANAFLVEEESYRAKQQTTASASSQGTATKPPAPLVEASPLVEEEKPWYTQKWFVIMLVSILIVTIIIAVAVPLATKKGPSSPVSNSPSLSTFPSVEPSLRPSFAPTMTTTITAVVQLDSNPSDTSWRIDCENGQKNLINIPTGTYIAAYSNRLITQPFDVGVGDTCTFLIADASQDGLEEGAFYRVFLGEDYTAPVPLVEGSGNFGSQAEISFDIMILPPTTTPTPVPSQSLSPTYDFPYDDPPTALTPTLEPSYSFPDEPPPVSPTTALPSVAPPTATPTAVVFVYITIVIQFDELPSETGWSLFCNGVEERIIPANTYSEPNGIISDTFIVQSGSTCEFTIRDTFGDGICCAFGDGYYQVLFHEEENGIEEGKFMTLENRTGVNPFSNQTVPFVASSASAS